MLLDGFVKARNVFAEPKVGFVVFQNLIIIKSFEFSPQIPYSCAVITHRCEQLRYSCGFVFGEHYAAGDFSEERRVFVEPVYVSATLHNESHFAESFEIAIDGAFAQ